MAFAIVELRAREKKKHFMNNITKTLKDIQIWVSWWARIAKSETAQDLHGLTLSMRVASLSDDIITDQNVIRDPAARHFPRN